MSSCTQLTLLSRSTTRSLNYKNNQLSSGRQSVTSLGTNQSNNGLLGSRIVVEQNPLPLQQFRPFSIAYPLAISNFNITNKTKQSISKQQQQSIPLVESKRKQTKSPTLSTDQTESICSIETTMSHNRLKQLKQVYSSNLYLFQCLAFIGFVLLTVRLYEVNKDINYLRHVSSTWLPNITIGSASVNTPSIAESTRLSTTVSMFTSPSFSLSDKITDQSSPLASPLTSSLVPNFDDEDEDNDESESRITTQSIKFVNDSSIELLPQPQALQFRSRTTSKSTSNGLSRSNGLTSPSSHSSNTNSISSSSTNGLSSTTSNTTPLSTQVENLQRESIQHEIDLAKARSAYFHVENLRKDVDSLIGDFFVLFLVFFDFDSQLIIFSFI